MKGVTDLPNTEDWKSRGIVTSGTMFEEEFESYLKWTGLDNIEDVELPFLFFRLWNKKTGVQYYSTEYRRKSKHHDSTVVRYYDWTIAGK
jgi:hypothetical protein